MFLYVSKTQHLSSPVRLTIDQLKSQDFNADSFQLFESEINEVSSSIPKMTVVSSSVLAKSNTWSSHDHIYGVRIKGNKRVGDYDTKADRIPCSCGKFAYKHVKVWDTLPKQIPLFVCQCHLVWVEKEI